jgi:hypothetical protein
MLLTLIVVVSILLVVILRVLILLVLMLLPVNVENVITLPKSDGVVNVEP